MLNDVGHLFENVARVWAWLPVIWKDRDFDYGYLDTIICFKLNRLQAHLADETCPGHHTTGKKDARRIREVIGHLERYRRPPYYGALAESKIVETPIPDEELPPYVVGPCNQIDVVVTYNENVVFPRRQWSVRHMQHIEKWHWDEAWRKIGKYMRHWWC